MFLSNQASEWIEIVGEKKQLSGHSDLHDNYPHDNSVSCNHIGHSLCAVSPLGHEGLCSQHTRGVISSVHLIIAIQDLP